MADQSQYKTEVQVSTTQAVTSLQALKAEVESSTVAFEALNKVVMEGEADLASMVSSVTALMAAQRQAATAEKDLASAKIDTAKATAIQQAADDKHAESLAKVAALQAKTGSAADSSAGTQAEVTAETQLVSALGARSSAEDDAANATSRRSNATNDAKNNELELQDSLSNTRYLLYDVGATYATMAAGLEAIPIAVSAVAASYQNDFAQVARVTDATTQQNQALYKSLEDIGTQLPVSFSDLTNIAQLGSQLGIATDQLTNFTEVTAKFSAVTQVSVDTASQLFGKLANSFDSNNQIPDFFNKIGSAVAEVGAKTVATDPQIATTVANIGSLGAAAGMSADQTVGLAAALASVQVQPYLARGTLTRVFGDITKAADDGGKSLDAWGKQLGISADQAQILWKTDPAAFFTQFVGSLNAAYQSGGNINQMLADLNIKSSNDVSSLTKLAVGYQVLQTSMQSAADGYNNGTVLDQQAAITFDTLISKLKEFANAMGNLGADLGSGALAPLQNFVSTVTEVVKFIDNLVNEVPGVKLVINALLGISLVTGAFLAFKSAQAFILAGMVSLQQTFGSAASEAMTTGGIMQQFAQTILMSNGATEQQAMSLLEDAGAFKSLGIAVTTTRDQITAMDAETVAASAAVEEGGVAAEASTSKFAAFGDGLKNIATSSIPLLAVAIGTTLIGQLTAAVQQAQDAGKAIADALAQGADQGAQAAATELNKQQMSWVDAITSGFSGMNENMSQVANDLGIPFQNLISIVTKGKAGLQDIQGVLDQVAQSKGFQSFNQMWFSPNADAGVTGRLEFLRTGLTNTINAMDQEQQSSNSTKSALAALGDTASATGDNIDTTTTATNQLDKSLKAINTTIFGTVDAAAAVSQSLNTLGGSLAKSGSFGLDSAGATNIQNFEKVLTDAQKYYAQFYQQTGDATAAAQQYAQFVQGLINSVQAKGGDLGSIKDLANQTIQAFQDTLNGATGSSGSGTGAAGTSTSSNAPTIPVTVNPAQVASSANAAIGVVGAAVENASTKIPQLGITANGLPAQYTITSLALDLAKITGQPYNVVMDALTQPGSQKAQEFQNYITQIVNGTYQSTVTSNTDPAYANVRAFATWAEGQLGSVQSYVNSVATTAPIIAQHLVMGVTPTNTEPSTPQPIKPNVIALSDTFDQSTTPGAAEAGAANAATDANNALTAALGNVADGYDNAAQKAAKAGAAGKQAGQDAANGINAAAAAANDYASRLQQGLTNAYDQQYGLQKATDDYHLALNKIVEARQADIDKVAQLNDQLKQARDALNGYNIDAAKAQTEANISLKYGDVARANDYQNQAQTALDNAAAKQKDINATQQQINTVQAGIGALTGYSDAAIQNRQALEGLETKMLAMVDAYAKTGATSEQVRAYAQKLGVQFQQQAGDAFQNQTAVDSLTGDMNRYVGVVNSVPYIKPTTVTANTQPATDAINGFKNWANQQSVNVQVNDTFKYVLVPNGVDGATGQSIYAVDKQVGTNSDGSAIYDGTGVKVFNEGGLVPGDSPSDPTVDNLFAKVDGKGMVKIRSGEFVMQQSAVDYWGKDFMDAINAMKMPAFNRGGSVGSGGGRASGDFPVMNLSAASLKAIASAVAAINVNLYTSDQLIAQSSQRGQTLLATKGIY